METATGKKQLHRQARVKGGQYWSDFIGYGLIEAAQEIAEFSGMGHVEIEVRDLDEPETILVFRMRKTCKYVCDNPRQGSD
jgi:hypothetical protein